MLNKKPAELKRELGVFDIAVNMINITVGSGIFLLPALVAVILGNSSLIAYIICGILYLMITICYAEMSSRFTTAGGAYIYIEKAFGPFVGFLANMIAWLGMGAVVIAALLNGVVEMLIVMLPGLSGYFNKVLLCAVIISFCTFINLLGVKKGNNVIKAITFIKLMPLILIVVVGLFNLKTSNLAMASFPGFHFLGQASLLLFFAFSGGECVFALSGEMKNPARTGPKGAIIGIIAVVLFYCLIHFVAQGVLGPELVLNKAAPLAAVGKILFGPVGFTLLITATLVSIFGTLNSHVLVFPRVIFAGSENGILPKYLSRLTPKNHIPKNSIITFCVIGFLLATVGGFEQLIILASASGLLLHVGVILSLIKFRYNKTGQHTGQYVVPGGLIIPVVSLIVSGWFLYQLKSAEMLGMGIFIVVLSAIYFLKELIKKRRAKLKLIATA